MMEHHHIGNTDDKDADIERPFWEILLDMILDEDEDEDKGKDKDNNHHEKERDEEHTNIASTSELLLPNLVDSVQDQQRSQQHFLFLDGHVPQEQLLRVYHQANGRAEIFQEADSLVSLVDFVGADDTSSIAPSRFPGVDDDETASRNKNQNDFKSTLFEEEPSYRPEMDRFSGNRRSTANEGKLASVFEVFWPTGFVDAVDVDDTDSDSNFSPMQYDLDNSFEKKSNHNADRCSEFTDNNLSPNRDSCDDSLSFDGTLIRPASAAKAVVPPRAVITVEAHDTPWEQNTQPDELTRTKDHIGQNDVVLGRGHCFNNLPGNQTFRDLVRTLAPVYHNARSNIHKRKGKVSEIVWRSIHSRGGCFLEELSASKENETDTVRAMESKAFEGTSMPMPASVHASSRLRGKSWRIVKKKDALNKVSQRFRIELRASRTRIPGQK